MNSTTSLQQIISALQAAERDLVKSQTKPAKITKQNKFDDSEHVLTPAPNEEVLRLQLDNQKLNTQLATLEAKLNSATSEINSLKSGNSTLAQDLYELKKENTNKSRENTALSSENDLLIDKILQVQDELETYYLDKLALEEALLKSNELIDTARQLITRSQNKTK